MLCRRRPYRSVLRGIKGGGGGREAQPRKFFVSFFPFRNKKEGRPQQLWRRRRKKFFFFQLPAFTFVTGKVRHICSLLLCCKESRTFCTVRNIYIPYIPYKALFCGVLSLSVRCGGVSENLKRKHPHQHPTPCNQTNPHPTPNTQAKKRLMTAR